MTGPMTLLVGLLLLSYLGSSFGASGKLRIATSSGVEHVVLGLVLGPLMLGVIERSWAETFEPVVLVGAAWLGFLAGGRWSAPDLARSWTAHWRGLSFALLVLALVAAAFVAAWHVVPQLQPMAIFERGYLVLGALMTLPVATPLSARLLLERMNADGPVRVLVVKAAQVVPFFPIVGAMLLFGMDSQWLATRPVLWVLGASVVAPVLVGVLLGLVTVGLISRFVRADQAWGVILGTTLLGAGLSIRLGMSAVATLFFIGLTLSSFRSTRSTLDELADATERPVLLPVALLLGATLRAAVPLRIIAAFAGVLVVRTGVVWLSGWLSRMGRKEEKLGSSFGFLLTMPAALPLALRSESSLRGASELHMPLLLLACSSLALHELLGQVASRRLQSTSVVSPPREPVSEAEGART